MADGTRIKALEYLVSRRPVVVRRRVRWGECDPAQVVFTPRFSDYAVSAAGFFFDGILGPDTARGRADKSNGFPLRALSFAFDQSLHPDQWFDMQVDVVDIRTRTFELAITGRDPANGDIFFRCAFVPICVAIEQRRAIAIPADVHAALTAYKAECAAATVPSDHAEKPRNAN